MSATKAIYLSKDEDILREVDEDDYDTVEDEPVEINNEDSVYKYLDETE